LSGPKPLTKSSKPSLVFVSELLRHHTSFLINKIYRFSLDVQNFLASIMFGLWQKSRIRRIELPRSKLTGYPRIAMRIYPKSVTPECLNRGPVPVSPVVSPVEPPIEVFGNDGLYFLPSFKRSTAFCTKDGSRNGLASWFLIPCGLKRS